MRLVRNLLIALAFPWAFPLADATEQEARKNIVLIAGRKSHGPEGNGIHDYAWSARLLKTMLENSNIRDQVSVTLHLNGWPHDAQMLHEADTIMVISDGRDGDVGHEAPHLATAQRLRDVDELVSRGCGVVVFHFSTFAPDALSEKALDWYGGYFDWETGGQRKWYSRITTQEATVSPASPHHVVLRGVEPFTVREEFYHDIRFREGDAGWIPVWVVESLPSQQIHGNVVAWAVERASGARGFATTCGHYYENWQDPSFRKTILNGLAWSAHVPIPEEGIESPFFSHAEIATHLGHLDLLSETDADEEISYDRAYGEEPYWYKPGHPINPAEPAAIKTLPGFQVEKILSIPESLGSWTAITVDARGRLICAAQHRPGLYRVTPPADADAGSEGKIEVLVGAAERVGWSHGLLSAFDALYVTVTESNDTPFNGVYRLRDTDGDDQYDDVVQLLVLDGSGEHGPHNIVVSPDRKWLYMICGNGTRLPGDVKRRFPSATEGVDHLMPPGFESSEYTPSGFVLRFRPDGSDLQLVCSGLRNSFDLAFHQNGDLFTFDSDMEWDLGSPWYRPTRICHLVPGGEFGWRGDAAIWPEYFADSVAPVVNVGPSSPTGVAFGYTARFPARYQHALFACDWTFATIHAIHLQPHGATYRGTIEEFLGGKGLPVTDLVIGADGAMYFLVGGRRLGSALYRVRYVGEQSTERTAVAEVSEPAAGLHALRRRLEEFHGTRASTAVQTAWPYLGHDDRAIRFAARVAIESQPIEQWRQLALEESNPASRITALLALARQEAPPRLPQVLAALRGMDIHQVSAEQILGILRVYELALARGGNTTVPEHARIRQKLRPLFPHADPRVNRELSRLLCYVGAPSIIDPLLQEMARDAGERPTLGSGYFVRNPKYGEAVRDMLDAAPLIDRLHYAQMLLWVDDGWTLPQRAEYFRLLTDATANSKGGHWYDEFWERIREIALDHVPDSQRQQLIDQSAAVTTSLVDDDLPQPVGPGRDWNLKDLLAAIESNFRDRDYQDGKRMFSAAQCVTCHRFNGEGSAVGPDLSSLGQRFTLRDVLEATVNPSKAVSDQYRVCIVRTDDGRTHSGRMVSRDSRRIAIATNLRRPTQTTSIDLTQVEEEYSVPISTMPEGLLNRLNESEVLNLFAYLFSGGDDKHPVFRR